MFNLFIGITVINVIVVYSHPTQSSSVYQVIKEGSADHKIKCSYLRNSTLFEPQPKFLNPCTDFNRAKDLKEVTKETEMDALCVLYYNSIVSLCYMSNNLTSEQLHFFNVSKADMFPTKPNEACTTLKKIQFIMDNVKQPMEVISNTLKKDARCQHLCSDLDGNSLKICNHAAYIVNATSWINATYPIKEKTPQEISPAVNVDKKPQISAANKSNVAEEKLHKQDVKHSSVLNQKPQSEETSNKQQDDEPHVQDKKPLVQDENKHMQDENKHVQDENKHVQDENKHVQDENKHVQDENKHVQDEKSRTQNDDKSHLEDDKKLQIVETQNLNQQENGNVQVSNQETHDKPQAVSDGNSISKQVFTTKSETKEPQAIKTHDREEPVVVKPEPPKETKPALPKSKIESGIKVDREPTNENQPRIPTLEEKQNPKSDKVDENKNVQGDADVAKQSETAVDAPSGEISEQEETWDGERNEDDAIDFEPNEAPKPNEVEKSKSKLKPHETSEDIIVPVNYDTQNMDADDSYFFSYFMMVCAIFILAYVGYHNKQKVLALVLEGRRGRRPSRTRRPNSANYHKLDSNLEEAVTSSCNKNTTNIIY